MHRDEEFARIIQRHLEDEFPSTCSCGVRFSCHGEFLERVTPIGEPVSFDSLEEEDDPPVGWTPMGMMAFANCDACGTTLSMSTMGMPVELRRELFAWVKTEARARGLRPRELMESVRQQIQAISREAWASEQRAARADF